MCKLSGNYPQIKPILPFSEEPEELESPRLVIKEEPINEVDNQKFEQENQSDSIKNQPESFENQITVKKEVEEEEEEEYEEDLIKLNFNIEDYMVKEEPIELDSEGAVGRQDSDTEESFTKDSMLEPEIVITGEHRKSKKLYRCTTCGFQAKHREYRNHIEYDCTKNHNRSKGYKCTKCDIQFGSMKKFLTHFDRHGYTPLSCPECLKQFKTFTYLGQHLQTHIKKNYVRVKLITYAGDETAKPDFQCRKCPQKVDSTEFFEHWETHIKPKPSHPVKVISGPNPWAKQEMHGQLHETIIKECIGEYFMSYQKSINRSS